MAIYSTWQYLGTVYNRRGSFLFQVLSHLKMKMSQKISAGAIRLLEAKKIEKNDPKESDARLNTGVWRPGGDSPYDSDPIYFSALHLAEEASRRLF